MRNHWLKSKSPSIKDIDTSTREGQWLLAALAKLSTESQTDKQPDEILQQVDELSTYMFHPYLCIDCGGSPACEEENKKNKFKCPKCGR